MIAVTKLEHQYYFSNDARGYALKICQFFVNGAFVIRMVLSKATAFPIYWQIYKRNSIIVAFSTLSLI